MRANLAAAEGQFAAKAHGPDVQPVGLIKYAGLKFGELGVGVMVIELAQQLLLGKLVAIGAVAADAHAEEPRPAPLALGLPDRVEDAGPDALEVAVAALAVE